MANVENNSICEGKFHGKNTPEAPTLENGQTVIPGKGLWEAREAAFRSDEEKETMDGEARRLKEELAEVEAGLKEIIATSEGKMRKALAAKDEAVQCSDRARARFQTAEHQLSRVTENSRLLRTRLEDMGAELEVARSAMSTTTEAGGAKHVDESAGEVGTSQWYRSRIESGQELCHLRSGPSFSSSGRSTESATLLRTRLEEMAAELEVARSAISTMAEAGDVREDADKPAGETLLERNALTQQRLVREASEGQVPIAHGLADEVASLRDAALKVRLEQLEKELREAKKLIASMEESIRREASCRPAALEKKRAGEARKVTVTEVVDPREKVEHLAGEDKNARDGELNYLRDSLEILRAELADVSTARDIDAVAAAVTASRMAALEARLEASVACVKLEPVEYTGWQVKAEMDVQEAQAEMNTAMEAAAAADPAREGTMLMENKANAREKATVYVKGLPWDTPDEDVKDFFKACGKTESIEQAKGSGSHSLGTALVTFDNITAALKAIEMNGHVLGGRWLNITMPIQKPKPDGCTIVFIGNLSWSIDECTVRQIFRECGDIKSVRFGKNRKTGEFRGFGHVEFYGASSADAAVELAGLNVMGRAIRVRHAGPRPPREDSSRGGRERGRSGGATGRVGGGRGGGRGRSEECKGKKGGEREDEGGSMGHEDEGERGEGRQSKDEGVGCRGGGEKLVGRQGGGKKDGERKGKKYGERKRKMAGERQGGCKSKRARWRQYEGESKKGVGRDGEDTDEWMGYEGKRRRRDGR